MHYFDTVWNETKRVTAKVPDEGSEVSKVRSTLQRSRHIYVIVLWYDVPFESALVASIFTATELYALVLAELYNLSNIK